LKGGPHSDDNAVGMVAIALVVLLLAGCGTARANDPSVAWTRATEVDGIQVWAAETHGDYWGYARGRVAATPEAIFRRIGDFESLPKVYPWLDRVRVLERGDHTALVYFHYDLPWPLSDQTYTAAHRWWTEPSGTIVLDVEDANALGPPPDGSVRVEHVLTRIVLNPASGGLATDVEYLFRADMAGLLPRAVKAQTAWKVPLNVVLSMRRSLEPTRGATRTAPRLGDRLLAGRPSFG
jgi:hypothetical protein